MQFGRSCYASASNSLEGLELILVASLESTHDLMSPGEEVLYQYKLACQGRLPYLLVFELHRSGCRCSVGGLQYFRLLVRGDAMIPGSGYAVPAISVTSSRFQQ